MLLSTVQMQPLLVKQMAKLSQMATNKLQCAMLYIVSKKNRTAMINMT